LIKTEIEESEDDEFEGEGNTALLGGTQPDLSRSNEDYEESSITIRDALLNIFRTEWQAQKDLWQIAHQNPHLFLCQECSWSLSKLHIWFSKFTKFQACEGSFLFPIIQNSHHDASDRYPLPQTEVIVEDTLSSDIMLEAPGDYHESKRREDQEESYHLYEGKEALTGFVFDWQQKCKIVLIFTNLVFGHSEAYADTSEDETERRVRKTVRVQKKRCKRNSKGRKSLFDCNICSAQFQGNWKWRRHLLSKRHLHLQKKEESEKSSEESHHHESQCF